MQIVSKRAIYITKGKNRNYGCRYTEFHVTDTAIFFLLIITLYRNGRYSNRVALIIWHQMSGYYIMQRQKIQTKEIQRNL